MLSMNLVEQGIRATNNIQAVRDLAKKWASRSGMF
jgi:hypothetical protein